MSTILIIVLVLVGLFALLLLFIAGKKIAKLGAKNKDKTKEAKNKKDKKQKIKEVKKDNDQQYVNKGSVDISSKFLFRKEFKVLVLVNKVLPKGYVAFPKIGADLILTPLGNSELYNSLHGKYIDLVVFEEETMKPKIAIDLYDGSLGDEPLDIESPEVLNALKIAEFPLVSFKVKTDYTNDEIKDPIFKALGIEEKKEGNAKNRA